MWTSHSSHQDTTVLNKTARRNNSSNNSHIRPLDRTSVILFNIINTKKSLPKPTIFKHLYSFLKKEYYNFQKKI